MRIDLIDGSFQTTDIAASYICRNNFTIACSPVEKESGRRTVVCLVISKFISDGADARFGRVKESKSFRSLKSCRNQSINLNDYAVNPRKAYHSRASLKV